MRSPKGVEPRILLDCRFLGSGGAGRVTELLLKGLAEIRPPGRWILWGAHRVAEFRWAGATCAYSEGSPLSFWGQRYRFSVPNHDVAIYVHQIRPWRPEPSLTFIHDTIPLHFGNPMVRVTKTFFLKTVARLSTQILTDSRYSADQIVKELGVDGAKIAIVDLPVEDEMAARIRSMRRDLPAQRRILFVGRFGPHKNLDRLIDAFARTRFFADGGTLHLVGGSQEELTRLSARIRRSAIRGVTAEKTSSQERLEELYATSSLLVMPSLEEGYGLPALEALMAGLRISVSNGGALPEIFGGYVTPFDAKSVTAIAEALDRDVEGPLPKITDHARPADFARSVVDRITSVIESQKPPSGNRTQPG